MLEEVLVWCEVVGLEVGLEVEPEQALGQKPEVESELEREPEPVRELEEGPEPVRELEPVKGLELERALEAWYQR